MVREDDELQSGAGGRRGNLRLARRAVGSRRVHVITAGDGASREIGPRPLRLEPHGPAGQRQE
ncbi:MAG: hypothetical protein DMF85_12135 [Acidobacteria bacterium]|nr:MAG: hypothetical protein DMF85_12135 [Acidobacteriota bacterium]